MFAHKDTSRTASAQELSEFPGMEEKKGFTISFTKRVMLVSIAVSLITIISSVVVLSAVWNQHFQSYTRENVQRVADGTAAAIAIGMVALCLLQHPHRLCTIRSTCRFVQSMEPSSTTIVLMMCLDRLMSKKMDPMLLRRPLWWTEKRWARYWCVFQDRKHS